MLGVTLNTDYIVNMNDEVLDRKIKDKMNGIKAMELEEVLEKKMSERCECYGPPAPDLRRCLLGLDVVALFPSMTSKRSGMIVRERVRKSTIVPASFDWKVGLV